jgi:hypothetical protein
LISLVNFLQNLETQQNVVLLRLNTSLRTDRFMTQEWVCLNLGMSAGNFREFDLDYRTNFKNIFNFLELQVIFFNLYKNKVHVTPT